MWRRTNNIYLPFVVEDYSHHAEVARAVSHVPWGLVSI